MSTTALFPGLVNITVSDGGSDSYFDITINDAVFNAWCIDKDTLIGYDSYSANVYSSYQPIPDGLVEQPQNLDLVNWILNQDYTSQGYTVEDVAEGIWTLVESDYTTNDPEGQLIANQAINYGEGFIPGPGEVIGVVVAPFDTNEEEKQTIIIPHPTTPCIDIEKKTNGVDGDTPEEAVVIAEGAPVEWTYEVKNCGNVPFLERDVNVSDDQGIVPILDRSTDVGNDGILSPNETWIYRAQGVAEPLLRTVDFDMDSADRPIAEGKTIGDQWKDWGLTISRVVPEGANNLGLTVFDSTNEPLTFERKNKDLGTPNEDFGGQGVGNGGEAGALGENREALDNVLILIREDTYPAITDEFSGGTFRFEFDTPQKVRDLSLLDIEELDGDGTGARRGTVKTYNAAGDLIREHEIVPYGNNSFQIMRIDDEQVSRMDVTFIGSGAISGLRFEDYYQNIGSVRVPGAEDDDPSHYVSPDPRIDIEKFTNGEDADTPEEAVGIKQGDPVVWTYRVSNPGNVAFTYDQVQVWDDDPALADALVFDPSSDRGNDRILSPGETWEYTATLPNFALQYTVDFDKDSAGRAIAEGQRMDSEYADWGFTISTRTRNGQPDYGATVVNSSNPTPYKKNDDLYTPDQNNVLILSRYEDVTPPKTTDRYDGGTFIFDWENAIDLKSINLLDIEEAGGKIRLYNADNQTIAQFDIPAPGNNSFQTLTLDVEDVDRMEVEFVGSGAITGFDFEREYKNTGFVSIDGNWDEWPVQDRDDSHAAPPRPGIDIEKFTNGVDADSWNTAAQARSGEVVTWEYRVTNTGNVDFDASQVSVTDSDADLQLVRVVTPGEDTLLSPGETWVYKAAKAIQFGYQKVDFDTDPTGNEIAEGTRMDNEFAAWGFRIETLAPEGRADYGATVLNSSNPNPYPKNTDLSRPDLDLRNVLILSRYADVTPPNTTDRYDGGTFQFTWDAPISLKTLGFLDIEEAGGTVRTFDPAGNLVDTYTIPVPGDREFAELALNDDNVARMEVNFVGSGAITGFDFERPYSNTATVFVQGDRHADVSDADTNFLVQDGSPSGSGDAPPILEPQPLPMPAPPSQPPTAWNPIPYLPQPIFTLDQLIDYALFKEDSFEYFQVSRGLDWDLRLDSGWQLYPVVYTMDVIMPTYYEYGGIQIAKIFDAVDYLGENADVAAAIAQQSQPGNVYQMATEAFVHFMQYGLKEGRTPSDLYDEAEYLAANGDVKAAVDRGDFASGLQHFFLMGHRENRNPSQGFNAADYLLQNPDVQAAVDQGFFASGFDHYLEHGAMEGRGNTHLYQEAFYLQTYGDVAAAVAEGSFQSGFEHYVRHGQQEGRNPSSLFNEQYYLGSNPDVQGAVLAGAFASGLEHFLFSGHLEGRSPHDLTPSAL